MLDALSTVNIVADSLRVTFVFCSSNVMGKERCTCGAVAVA
jgi:hypothetical protein